MRRSRVLMQTAAACALALTLAGCGSDNPKPAPAPTKSASASPTGEVAPTMPAEAKGTSEAAAKAFARHFIALLNYSEVTGDTAALRQLFDPACAGCLGIVDGLEQVHQDGGSIETNGWSIRTLTSSVRGVGVLVVARVDVAPQVVTLKTGAKPKRFPGSSNSKRRLFLAHKDAGWIVNNLDEG